MAKKQPVAQIETGSEVVEELHTSDADVEYTDVTGKDDLPEGVTDPADDKDEGEKTPAAKKPEKAASAAEDELPEELKGKTPAQLAKMYRDAQSVIGRQGSELGELRRTADQYIKARLTAETKPVEKKEEPAKAPDAVDFFTNPTESVSRLIESHPALRELQGAAKELAAREIQRRRDSAETSFKTAHPDAGEVLADEGFRQWILKSPVRQAMLVRAHKHYDLDAANEVFNTWKELKAARTPATPAKAPGTKPAGKEAARVPTGGNASPRAEAKGGEKIFRRADVIRLMEQDPDRYAMMADEITKAYTEGRVR